jgi:hypothetical protein
VVPERLSCKRIASGNPDIADLLAIKVFLHIMQPEQLALVLELTNERLAAKGKNKLTHQELLWWIGTCILIASNIFCSDHHKL